MKVLGTRNPADVLTKHVPRDTLEVHLRTLGVSHEGGRAEVAPSLASVAAYNEEHASDEGGKKKVTFAKVVCFRSIPAVGKGRPWQEAKKTRMSISEASERASRSIDSVEPCIEGGALGDAHLEMMRRPIDKAHLEMRPQCERECVVVSSCEVRDMSVSEQSPLERMIVTTAGRRVM